MLKLITLHTIKQIFEVEAIFKLSAQSQMLYINCITHYLKDKPATIENCVAFNIPTIEFGKTYEKNLTKLKELQNAGLVHIGEQEVTFNSAWNKYIDKTSIGRVTPTEYIGMIDMKPPKEFKNDLIKNDSLFELCHMKFKLDKKQVTEMVEIFLSEQTTVEKMYPSSGSCIKHFTNWLPKAMANKPQVAKSVVKSTGKMLGR